MSCVDSTVIKESVDCSLNSSLIKLASESIEYIVLVYNFLWEVFHHTNDSLKDISRCSSGSRSGLCSTEASSSTSTTDCTISWLSCLLFDRLEVLGRQDSLLANLASDEGLEEVVGDLLKFLNAPDVSANNSLLFFVDSDCAEDLCVGELLVVEVLEGSWQLVLIFLIEDDLARGSIVVDLKNDTHGFFTTRNYSAHDNDLAHLLSVDLESVIWCDRGFIDHLESDRDEDLILAGLLLLLVSTSEPCVSTVATIVVVAAGRGEEARVVVSEL